MEEDEPTALELLWASLAQLKKEKPEGLSEKGRLYAIAITFLQLIIGFVYTFIHLNLGESGILKITLFSKKENDTPT